MPICGLKCSICWVVLGVWGIIQLALMGVFLRVHAVAFAEDLPINDAEWEASKWNMDYVYKKYDAASNNCFVAAGVYVCILVFSGIQYRLNTRQNYVMQ
ncbi:ribonuclease kappa-like [Lineus longissimus]|uniref:ribonuclease kappa-like n=1 Tax=Lineus longissimus TaxID=88925 RepID=UPI002B4F0FF6